MDAKGIGPERSDRQGFYGHTVAAVLMLPLEAGFAACDISKVTDARGASAEPVAFFSCTRKILPLAFAGQAIGLPGFLAQPLGEFLRIIPGNHDDRTRATAPAIIGWTILARAVSHATIPLRHRDFENAYSEGFCQRDHAPGGFHLQSQRRTILGSLPEGARRNDHH